MSLGTQNITNKGRLNVLSRTENQCRENRLRLEDFKDGEIYFCGIGGTSMSGGVGSIWGAIVGALVMSRLDNGMGLMNIE